MMHNWERARRKYADEIEKLKQQWEEERGRSERVMISDLQERVASLHKREDELKKKEKELELLEQSLHDKEEELQVMRQSIQTRTEELDAKNTSLEQEREVLQLQKEELELKVQRWEQEIEMRQDRIEQLEQAETKWRVQEEHLQDLVLLNVGGRSFYTSKRTLCQSSLFFQALFCGKFEARKTPEGAVFIDRSPTYFEPLLELMRSGRLDIPPGLTVQRLMEEATYYGVHLDESQITNEEEVDFNDEAQVLKHEFNLGTVSKVNFHHYVTSKGGGHILQLIKKAWIWSAANAMHNPRLDILWGEANLEKEIQERTSKLTEIQQNYIIKNVKEVYMNKTSKKDNHTIVIDDALVDLLGTTVVRRAIIRYIRHVWGWEPCISTLRGVIVEWPQGLPPPTKVKIGWIIENKADIGDKSAKELDDVYVKKFVRPSIP